MNKCLSTLPNVKQDLVPDTLSGSGVLEIVHAVATLVGGQRLDEVVVLRLFNSLLDADFLHVVGYFEDDVAVSLPELQILESVDGIRGDVDLRLSSRVFYRFGYVRPGSGTFGGAVKSEEDIFRRSSTVDWIGVKIKFQ